MTTISLPTPTGARVRTTVVGAIVAAALAVVAAVSFAAVRDTPTDIPAPAPTHVGSADTLERQLATTPQSADYGSADAADRWSAP